MPDSATLDLTITTMDNPDCSAANLLNIFDQQGEAFMLNELHAEQPTFNREGTAVLSDNSAVAFLPKTACYVFGSSVEQTIDRENAIRRSRFGVPLLDPLSDDNDDWPLPLDLTYHRVMAHVVNVIAAETGTELPACFHPHAGLLFQIAPNAPETLQEIVTDALRDPDDHMLDEKLDEILELLAKRLIKLTPSHQMDTFRAVVRSLDTRPQQPDPGCRT